MYAVCRSHLCIVKVREYEVQDIFPLQGREGDQATTVTPPVAVRPCTGAPLWRRAVCRPRDDDDEGRFNR